MKIKEIRITLQPEGGDIEGHATVLRFAEGAWSFDQPKIYSRIAPALHEVCVALRKGVYGA